MLLSAFFSASETALFSLSRRRFRKLKEKNPGAKRLNPVFRQPDLFLAVIVFGNMVVNIALTSLNTRLFASSWGDYGILFSILVSGGLILFFGEILPKTLAIHSAERLALALGPALVMLFRFISPLVRSTQNLVGKITGFLVREKKPFSEERFKMALVLGRELGTITEAEEELISYVLEFKDTQVSEILTPRVEVQGIEENSSQEQVECLLQEQMHSKLPVYKGSLDNITGILQAKDVFLNFEQNWKKFIRKPVLVPESRRIDDLLQTFLDQGERIAVVLDEYGGTAGIVTLEDIEEEIFGEIYDEFEVPHKMIEQKEENKWLVYGKIPVKTLNLECDLDLPEEEDTLAGLILSRLERLPHARERIEFAQAEVVVERVTVKRIISVTVNKR